MAFAITQIRSMNKNIINYYSKRAKEYEKVYAKPERQVDLQSLKSSLPLKFTKSKLLEIGCGTGFWTYYLANQAEAIYATDINETVLEIARSKFPNNSPVTFAQSDMYELKGVNGGFDAGFAGFVWSHVPISRLRAFLKHFHSFLDKGSKIVFIDNQYVEGSNTPIYNEDEEGNTFQMRKLDDGTEHLVMKNFPEDSFFKSILRGIGKNIEIERMEYYWVLTYETI